MMKASQTRGVYQGTVGKMQDKGNATLVIFLETEVSTWCQLMSVETLQVSTPSRFEAC